ncbi:transketolase [Helicobacter sp. MIT 00-7814]|uniref:transketolase n=1 Tax=unclassified Helicobacter TaxID=2593540 RepID=UPI000E1E859C|nr:MULTISPECIES: transketolase [unclassified Helicobacter]RDU53720.1 transketolase [Helicobacter sp. MIT 99-10781]RDU54106.1 transketolase [Helicobacter sp. MIT 00-7814]
MKTHEIAPSDIPQLSKMASTLRFLCADMVQRANSGHPGAPLGLADIAVVLSLYIRLNPSNPTWLNRDRVIFSGGHASALVYSLLHLWGFEVSLEDLQNFRKLDSKTPGHPEFSHTPGVEVTTGPLGQGIANAVGMAMASKYAKNTLGKNARGQEVINHNVFCFCGDGDLQEGISYEACSLAGKHKLENFILIYDSNNISIEGAVSKAFDENIPQRFKAQGFEVFECDGHDFASINNALKSALDSKLPSIIIAHTTIAKGALSLEGSHKSHGAPLGEEIIAQAKQSAGFDPIKTFEIPNDCLLRFRNVAEVGALANLQWENELDSQVKEKIAQMLDFDKVEFPRFEQDKAIATRVSNGEILNAIAKAVPGFLGGSADLAPSNNTELKGESDFPNGRNFHFGIREHAMGAICNGIANYGLFAPFCATFFVFSDYLTPSIRIASLMRAQVFYVFTHDSIGVGEDGATHQPIEQLSHLRAMPNLLVFRPSDANENAACWEVALKHKVPSAFILSRQNLAVISNPTSAQVAKGAYILRECKGEKPQITLIASGSEVDLALKAQEILESQNIATRVVSAPSYDLLIQQDKDYVDSLFGSSKVLAIEAARGLEWYKFADCVFGIESFGASGKGDALFARFGFEAQNIANKAKDLL